MNNRDIVNKVNHKFGYELFNFGKNLIYNAYNTMPSYKQLRGEYKQAPKPKTKKKSPYKLKKRTGIRRSAVPSTWLKGQKRNIVGTRKYGNGYKKYIPKNGANARKALIKSLAAPDYNNYELAETYKAPSSTSALGIQCQYFTMGGGYPYGSGDPQIHQAIAYQINSNANQDIAYEEVSMKQVHEINSSCNFNIELEGWKLMVRRDLPNVSKYASGILNDLTQGFMNSGLAATAVNCSQLSPFNANSFLCDYKVIKHFKKQLMPGMGVKVYNNSKKTKMIRPSQFIYMSAGQTYNTGSLTLADRRGETYWLFRIHSTQIAHDTTTLALNEDLGAKITMLTKTCYEYKYVQDINSITNNFVGGVSTYNAATTMPVTIAPFTGVLTSAMQS